ncbi:hypothetical protein M422DRAFT_55481 [Sphaerobolus stellatus SS14]|uniref:Ferritin-like domain-containing protein n=1 Tax=Sphaerobolus stellatus (strain SS14) TaxID=990650 RepID=A0A0C9UML9_SPHS4|nr:hypothetical protein M422DRAFT_55481 [Sphaerobolus stellatus SS14]
MRAAALCWFIVKALGVSATPQAERRTTTYDEATILQYALTLEHLKNAFYAGAIAKFDQRAHEKFAEISAHEKRHVVLFEVALRAAALKPCTYGFLYTYPKSFVALSQILEGVGTSAFTGAAQFLTSKALITKAASIRIHPCHGGLHAAWVASSVN